MCTTSSSHACKHISVLRKMATLLKRKASAPDESKGKQRKETKKSYSASRITIGSEVERWRKFKKRNKFKSNQETARFLLDHISQCGTKARKEKLKVTTSTPAKAGPSQVFEAHVSGISSASSDTQSTTTATATEGMRTDEETTRTAVGTDTSMDSVPQVPSSSGAARKQSHGPVSDQKSASFIDPFNLSIEVTSNIEEDEEEDEDDPDYEPSFNYVAVLPDDVNKKYSEVVFEEEAFGQQNIEEEDNEEPEEDEPSPSIHRLRTEADSVHLIDATVCLAYVTAILSLARLNIVSCPVKGCPDPTSIIIQDSFIGSALYLKWICAAGHIVHRWCAQPVLNRRLHGGDLMFALSTLTSGNNFGKLSLLAKHMNFKILSRTTFHKIQRTYLIPTIDSYWEKEQNKVISSFEGQKLIVMGDGRNDSPGHSAQYCSYTIMEYDTKQILTLKTLDKRTTDRKSANMEKVGFQQAIEELTTNNIQVAEVVTDAHLGIGSIMKTKYAEIKHSHDIWHAAKNLGKRLGKIVKKKANRVLIPWQKDIVNHFWFACSKADSFETFLGIWRSVLHHIINTHEWVLSQGTGIHRCMHDPLDENEAREKPWLSTKEHAPVLQDLQAVVLDKRFLNKVSYYLNYRTTADIEVFHQLVLMYCAKRFAYSPPVYRIRNLLAAIDHNYHIDRPLKTNKDGEISYHRCYNKKSQRWSVFPEKAAKSYGYVREMSEMLFNMRINDKVGMGKKMELEEDDPRRLSKHLSEKSPPATSEIAKAKVTRIMKK